MSRTVERIAFLLRQPGLLTQGGNVLLRPYQEVAIQAVVDGVYNQRGMSFVWIFPRQSGKDEALATLVQFLLARFSQAGAEMVFFNPTFKPQTETSMRRLEARLSTNILTRSRWTRRSGYIFQFGNAYCTYLSADPTAHVVSATANRLLVVNEAQDVGLLKYDKDIAPMAASANAPKLFAGTRWTSDTLLEREYRFALQAEKQDGLRRVFFFTAEDVRQVLPEYGQSVDEAVARLGRDHPLVKTQFFCETVDARAGMFPPERQALMHGSHAPRSEPEPGGVYAFLIDVAGQDEASVGAGFMPAHDSAPLQNPGRDSTALKIVEVDSSSLKELGRPIYRAVFRKEWQGARHVQVFGALKGLVQTWDPKHIFIDATGVGEGLWSLLDNAFGSKKVTPVRFTARVKSDMGYAFIGMVESGRYLEYHPFPASLRIQLDKCRSDILPGPSRLMRWSVPDGTRDDQTGDLVHDDDLMTAAMCTLLDELDWHVSGDMIWVPGPDPWKRDTVPFSEAEFIRQIRGARY